MKFEKKTKKLWHAWNKRHLAFCLCHTSAPKCSLQSFFFCFTCATTVIVCWAMSAAKTQVTYTQYCAWTHPEQTDREAAALLKCCVFCVKHSVRVLKQHVDSWPFSIFGLFHVIISAAVNISLCKQLQLFRPPPPPQTKGIELGRVSFSWDAVELWAGESQSPLQSETFTSFWTLRSPQIHLFL